MNALKKKFSILLSENDPDYQFLCQIAMSEIDRDIEFNVVYSGEQLLHFIQKQKIERDLNRQHLPNLIIARYQPGSFDLDHIRELKQMEKAGTIPVVLLADEAGKEFTKTALQAGVREVHVRPYTFMELKQLLTGLVQRYPSKRLTKSLFCCRCEDFVGYDDEHALYLKSISLSEPESKFIRSRFSGPLCVPCLNQLRTSYRIIHGDYDPGDGHKKKNFTLN